MPGLTLGAREAAKDAKVSLCETLLQRGVEPRGG